MKIHILNMEIIDEINGTYIINISNKNDFTIVSFLPDKKELDFFDKNELAILLKSNEYQFRKILHNKRKETYYKGFKLKFVLQDKKDVKAFNDKLKIAVIDKTKDEYNYFIIEKGIEPIYKLFTDGSYNERTKTGGYAFLIKGINNNTSLCTGKLKKKSSNLIELIAVIKGLQKLKRIKYVRIISDSQYVKKGITEWVINWKLNNWITANGEKVKYIRYWKRLDKLTEKKYIEFEWIKAHSFHFENMICDYHAKKSANF